MKRRPELSIVFATKNRLPWLRRTMSSIYEDLTGRQDYEIVVVDGQSTDRTTDYLKNCQNVRLIVEEPPRGCCFAYDTALRAATGEWVCWLNDDIEIVPGAFDAMHAFVNRPDNQKLGMGAFLASHLHGQLDTFVVHNCFGLPLIYADFGYLRRKVLEEVDYLDLRYRRYFWDPDLALKIWATGKSVLPCPGAHIKHYFLEDDIRRSGEEQRKSDFNYFRDKWYARANELAADVYRDISALALINEHLEKGSVERVLENGRVIGGYAS